MKREVFVSKRRRSLLWCAQDWERSPFKYDVHICSAAGFSHPLSTVRTRTQELLTTLFFIHSPDVSG